MDMGILRGNIFNDLQSLQDVPILHDADDCCGASGGETDIGERGTDTEVQRKRQENIDMGACERRREMSDAVDDARDKEEDRIFCDTCKHKGNVEFCEGCQDHGYWTSRYKIGNEPKPEAVMEPDINKIMCLFDDDNEDKEFNEILSVCKVIKVELEREKNKGGNDGER